MSFTIAKIRNPQWLNQNHTVIGCEVDFDEFDEDWVKFVAIESGDYPHTHQIFAECVAGKWGPIAEYVPPTNEDIARQVRSERDSLIGRTDWTQAADVPQATKDKWAPYRQALRDITEQAGFPMNVTWPTKPE